MRTRRTFLAQATAVLATGAVGGCAEFGEAVRGLRTGARVGVLANLEIEWPASAAAFRRALRFYRQQAVDAIVLIGDLTRNGYRNQYEVLASAYREIWRGSRPPRTVLVRGAADESRWKDEYAELLRPIGDVFAPTGTTVTVGNLTLGASYYKHYGDWPTPPSISLFASLKESLTSDLGFEFRQANAGSLHGVTVPRGFEPVAEAATVAQGLLVEAVGGRVELRRLDFSQKGPVEDVAPAWSVPLDPAEPLPSDPPRAPQFAEGASLVLVPGYRARVREPGTEEILTVRWPTVLARQTGVRAYHYELTARVGGQTFLVRRLHSPAFARQETHEPMVQSCVLEKAGLPTGPISLSVTPVSSCGVRGRPLAAVVQ